MAVIQPVWAAPQTRWEWYLLGAAALLLAAVAVASITISSHQQVNRDFNEAVFEGDTAKAKVYLAQGADVNAQVDGCQALLWAAFNGNAVMAQLLLDRGANTEAKAVNEKGETLTTALIEASSGLHSSSRIVKMLLSKGAVVDGRDRFGFTPLYLAAWRGHPAIVRLLLSAGANVSGRDPKGYTPLGIALKEQWIYSFKFSPTQRKLYPDFSETVRILKRAAGKT